MFARTVTVTNEFDLNSVCRGDGFLFVRDGVGYAGRGTIALLTEAEVRTTLTSITSVTTDAIDVVAFSLIPFRHDEPATFFVPRFTIAKHDDGSRTATLIGRTADEVTEDLIHEAIADATRSTPPRPSANSFRVSPRMPISHYLDAVLATRDAVRSGALRKAVIARDIEVHAEDPIDVHGVLQRLRASFGSSYRFCVGNMIGASPELLVETSERMVRSHPLAGTAPRTGDPETDSRLASELIASTKNQVEHRVVIDMVRDTLLPFCSYLDWEAEPSIVTVANVQHLGTAIEGALTEPKPHILDLVRLLCPTPALGGYPSREAMQFIQETEELDRGAYGGAVGYITPDGDGIFAVTIRCAELSADRRSARLFAGGGIVSESDPYSELAETQAKFQAMLSAIVRP